MTTACSEKTLADTEFVKQYLCPLMSKLIEELEVSAGLPEFVDKLIIDGTKVGWYPDRIAAWRRGERIAPVTIDCAMTRACNAACHFCYAQLQASESDGKITRDSFFNFLDDAAEIGVKGVSFISDGESTVVPWWANAVCHAAGKGLAVGAGSNGIRLTRGVLEISLPHLAYLRFNFSAGERKRYAEIMGVPQADFDLVVHNIKAGMEIVNRDDLPCTLNMQMVCDPKDGDQIVPFAKLAAELRPTYAVIKHCADDVDHKLGVDYSKYEALLPAFDEAERIGREAGVRIEVKRGRLDGKRKYTKCFGPPFIMQISGNGLVAPCGFMFNERYKKFHIGNITRQRFKDIWSSARYKEVMDYLAGDQFNPQERCGPNCLQHNTNDWLFRHVNGQVSLPVMEAPPHLEFL